MIKVLVADDYQDKIRDIRRVLDLIPEFTIESYDIAQDIITAKSYLVKKHYDLLILDLNLPMRAGDDIKAENGINFLDEINRSYRLIKPHFIIGLTAYPDNIQRFREKFQNELWALIRYEKSDRSWEKLIRQKLEYLIQSKRDIQSFKRNDYDYDLAVITALRITEFDSVLNLNANWTSFYITNDATEYYKGTFSDGIKTVRVVAASAPQMGMVAAAVLTMKLIDNFRPKFVAMVGIAAGVEGVGNFGDILVSDISFDSASGKIKTNENKEAEFMPDYHPIELSIDIKEAIQSCKGKREYLDEIKRRWPADKPDTELNIHIGPFASGGGVVENRKVIDEIKGHNRKLIGIDMETYGVLLRSKKLF